MRHLRAEMDAAALNGELVLGGPLERFGVPRWRELIRAGELGLASVEFGRDRLAQIVPFGQRKLCLAIPVLDLGDLTDIVVIDPERPSRWGLVRGDGRWLGDAAIQQALAHASSPDAQPLPLFADALAWLRAGRAGAVLLNGRAAADELREVQEISVPDQLYQSRLARVLEPPRRMPEISVSPQRPAASSGGDSGRGSSS